MIDAAGRDVVIYETVGVGQSEIAIAALADIVALVLMPGSGDSIQALKAGIMEIPDLVVLNKSDLPGSKLHVRELAQVLRLAEEGQRPGLVETSARTGDGRRGDVGRGRRPPGRARAVGRARRAPAREPRARGARARLGDAPRAGSSTRSPVATTCASCSTASSRASSTRCGRWPRCSIACTASASSLTRVVGIEDIRAARELLAGVALHTPVLDSRTFSDATGATVLLKAENLQRTGLVQDPRRDQLPGAPDGCPSARPASSPRAPATTRRASRSRPARSACAPRSTCRSTPRSRSRRDAQYGAEVVLEGESFDDAQAAARRDAGGRPFISAFDDEHVVAGQGTVGLEMPRTCPAPTSWSCRSAAAGCCRASRSRCRRCTRPAASSGCRQRAARRTARRSRAGEPRAAARSARSPTASRSSARRGHVPAHPRPRRRHRRGQRGGDLPAMVGLLERAKLRRRGRRRGRARRAARGTHPASPARRSCACSRAATSTRRCCRPSCATASPSTAATWSAAPRSSTGPGSLRVLLGLLAEDRINIVDVEHHREGIDARRHRRRGRAHARDARRASTASRCSTRSAGAATRWSGCDDEAPRPGSLDRLRHARSAERDHRCRGRARRAHDDHARRGRARRGYRAGAHGRHGRAPAALVRPGASRRSPDRTG